MTSQKTDQPKAKPQLKKQMKQSALNQPKHRVYPTIVLPPPPPLPPETGKQSTKNSSVSASQQFMSPKKQAKRVIQDKPVKIHKVLKPTAEYISKYTHRNIVKKRQETAPAKLKDYQRLHTKTANFEKAKLLKIKDFSKGRVLLKKFVMKGTVEESIVEMHAKLKAGTMSLNKDSVSAAVARLLCSK